MGDFNALRKTVRKCGFVAFEIGEIGVVARQEIMKKP
jgi:hypothetical protein